MWRLRTATLAGIGVLVLATAASLWATAWPRWHDAATEAAVAARQAAAAPVARSLGSRHAPPKPKPQTGPQTQPKATPPEPVYAPSPAYPMEALRAGRGGTVLLAVQVDGAGQVTAVTVAAGSGDPALDAAARTAVKQWRFAPPAGQRPQRFRLPVHFRIQASAKKP